MTTSTCYVVKMGRKPGIYDTWQEVKEQTDGFMGASFKKCGTRKEAKELLGIKDEKDVKKLEMEQTLFLSKGLNLLTIYVDGSYEKTESIYSYAFIVLDKGKITYKENGATVNKEVSKNLDSAAGELKAAMKAIKYAGYTGKRHIVIYYDNMQIKNLIDGTNKPKNEYQKKYIEFVNKVIDLYDLKLDFTKVKAHNGNEYNELVDRLAKEAMRKKREGIKNNRNEDKNNEIEKVAIIKDTPKKVDKKKAQISSWGFDIVVKHRQIVKDFGELKRDVNILAIELAHKAHSKKVQLSKKQALEFYSENLNQMVKSCKKMLKKQRRKNYYK